MLRVGDKVRHVEGFTGTVVDVDAVADVVDVRRDDTGAFVWDEIHAFEAADEVRVVDPKTGGAKGQKLPQLGGLDPAALLELAKVAGAGAKKYERFNYAKGYAWSLSYDALFRHVLAFLNGEDNDPDDGLPHMAHAAWHCLALLTFSLRGRGTDDRFPR